MNWKITYFHWNLGGGKKNLHVRARKTLQGIEAETSIFNEHRAVNLNGSQTSLLFGDIFRLPLQFRQVKLERLKGNGLPQYGFHFFQFLGVPRYERHRPRQYKPLSSCRRCHFAFFWNVSRVSLLSSVTKIYKFGKPVGF